MLDRTKEPGAIGEPLYLDVVTALVEHWHRRADRNRRRCRRSSAAATGCRRRNSRRRWRRGRSRSRRRREPKRHFTVGIRDDVTHLSLDWDPEFSTERDDVTRAVFYGLGSDGTVGASKNSVKIIGENTPLYAQGYFVYDSKKAGSITVSHLRFSPRPINSTYLIERANFVACHQFNFLERMDVLAGGGARGDVSAEQPLRSGRGVGQAAARSAATDHREAAAVLRGRWLERRRRRRA